METHDYGSFESKWCNEKGGITTYYSSLLPVPRSKTRQKRLKVKQKKATSTVQSVHFQEG